MAASSLASGRGTAGAGDMAGVADMAGAVVDTDTAVAATVTDAADLQAVAGMPVECAVVMPVEHAVSQVAELGVERQ